MTACLALAEKKKKKYMRKVKSKEALIKLTLNSSVMLQFTGWSSISVMHDSRHTGDTRWILLPLSPRRPRTPWQHTTQDIQYSRTETIGGENNSVNLAEWPSHSQDVTANIYFQNGFQAQMLPIWLDPA